MVSGKDYKKWILYTILVVHIIWLIIHCFLSYQGWINQWKLTGYGMYTGPAPKLYLEIYLGSDEDVFTTKIYSIKDRGYEKINYDFGFYCLETNADKINILLRDNPKLVGKDIHIVVSGLFMGKSPISSDNQVVSKTYMKWIDEETYQYTGEIPKCDGKTYSGQGRFVAED